MDLASKEINKLFKEKYFPDEKQNHENKEIQQSIDKPSTIFSEEEDIQFSNTEPPDKEIRKIFRKIATKIHPDKQESVTNDSEKEKNTRLYQKAAKAKDEGDIAILFDIASDLGLNFTVNKDIIKKTETRILNIKKELQKIESTYVWSWFFAIEEDKKEKILEELFKLMYEKAK